MGKIKALTYIGYVVDALGLKVVDDYIFDINDMSSAKKEKKEDGEVEYTLTPLTSRTGYPFVMPTPNALKSLFAEEEGSNVLRLAKLPFNCIGEDVITGRSESTSTMISYMQTNINTFLFEAGLALLKFVQDDSKLTASSKSLDDKIINFLTELSDYTNNRTKSLVDNETIKLWKRIFSKVTEDKNLYSYLNVANAYTHNGKKYTRAASMKFPLVKELNEVHDDDPNFLGIKLRNKDFKILKTVFKFLLSNITLSNGEIVTVSNHTNFPTFDACMKLYLLVTENIFIVRDTLNILLEKDNLLLKVETPKLTLKSLESDLESIKSEILRIPLEKAIMRSEDIELAREETKVEEIVEEIPEVTLPNVVKPLQTINTAQPQVVNVQPTAPVYTSNESSTLTGDEIRKAMYGTSSVPLRENILVATVPGQMDPTTAFAYSISNPVSFNNPYGPGINLVQSSGYELSQPTNNFGNGFGNSFGNSFGTSYNGNSVNIPIVTQKF